MANGRRAGLPRRSLGLLLGLLSAGASGSQAAEQLVRVVVPQPLPRPAEFGLSALEASLKAKGMRVQRGELADAAPADLLVVAGLAGNDAVVRLLQQTRAALPSGTEALTVQRTVVQGKPALVLCGADARGLMYAALDAADRVAWSSPGEPPFAHIRDGSEKPFLAERAVSIYTMNRATFESRLHDEEQWRRYFWMLARSRINSFVVIFGYENGGYMAPPYPYFFDTPGFAGVRTVGMTAAQQQKNAAAFRRMIELAHERGIDVTAGIWDHIYRGGVQSGGIPGASELAGKEVPGLVTGLDEKNLGAYTTAALRKFLDTFPDIDALQFRMHGESGLKREEMEAFWHDVFLLMRRHRPGMRVDLRAKELPDSIIDDALKLGLKARVTTKYWMEQMGLPFHPTHINRENQRDRRHGYADLLRYPQRYKVHWRLWNGGTTRLLLWGDPEYVKRFVHSARLYDGDSFEVNEMLATKMLGEPHDAPPRPIHNERYRFYDYEFERYWYFYQLWGRLGYDPNTPQDVWGREFLRRFGDAAGPPLMTALNSASRVLPRIVAAAYRYQLFPTTRGWAEMMRQGDLPQYAALEGSDTEQFLSPRDEAKRILAREDTAKRRPEETAAFLGSLAMNILEHAASAEKTRRAGANKELSTTLADVRILAHLALFHASRLEAAVSYNLWKETGQSSYFDDAIGKEKRAVAEWEKMVAAAGDVYATDLAFGVHRVGFPRHWKEELERLREGLAKLTAERGKLPPSSPSVPPRPPRGTGDGQPPVVQIMPGGMASPGLDFRVTAKVNDRSGLKWVRLRYRHLTQFEDYETAEMKCDATSSMCTGVIPAAFINPKWDLIWFIEAVDQAGNGRMYPDLEQETPYVVTGVRR
jgi:hypothetical protein